MKITQSKFYFNSPILKFKVDIADRETIILYTFDTLISPALRELSTEG